MTTPRDDMGQDHHAADRGRRVRTPQETRDHINSDHPCCIGVGDAAALLAALAAKDEEIARLTRAWDALADEFPGPHEGEAWEGPGELMLRAVRRLKADRDEARIERDKYRDKLTKAEAELISLLDPEEVNALQQAEAELAKARREIERWKEWGETR